jgi:hypothetical protein
VIINNRKGFSPAEVANAVLVTNTTTAHYADGSVKSVVQEVIKDRYGWFPKRKVES